MIYVYDCKNSFHATSLFHVEDVRFRTSFKNIFLQRDATKELLM